ncbi:MAG: glycosyltransferase family 9 protein [Ignavibacteriaceae bacterium]
MKELEIFFRKLLLKLLILMNRAEKKQGKLNLTKDSKILFVRLNRIGDALVTTPLIYAVKKEIGCKVYILADSKNYFIFNSPKLADEILIFEKGFFPLWDLIRRVNRLKFDAVIDLHDDVSTTVSYLLAYIRVPNKVGLQKENSKLYSQTVPKLDPVTNHVVDRVMNLSKLFSMNGYNEEINIRYFPEATAYKKADTFISNNYPDKKFLVGINISAGNEARFWGIENFRNLFDLLKNYPVDILILSSTRDLHYALQICHDRKKIFYSPSFDEFTGMISRIDLLFSPDTATIHLASIYKKPVFGLYVQYNTEDIIWYPYKSDYEVVVTKDPNLDNVTFESVTQKFILFFEKHFKNK